MGRIFRFLQQFAWAEVWLAIGLIVLYMVVRMLAAHSALGGKIRGALQP